MAMTHERLAVSSGLHTILTNYRFSGSPNLQNPQPTTSLLDKFINLSALVSRVDAGISKITKKTVCTNHRC